METEEIKPATLEISMEDAGKENPNNNQATNGFKIPENSNGTEVSSNIDYSRAAIIKLVEIEASESETDQTDVDCTPIDEKNLPNFERPDDLMECEETNKVFSQHERLVDYFCDRNVVELARCSWRGSSKRQKYLRGVAWSPDGTCVLTTINGDGMHVIELPSDLYAAEAITDDRPLDVLQSAVHIKEGGTVYDYCWYPFMNSSNPQSCCWLATRQHEPIQMWDAYNGEMRCSYRGYNAVDEVESALSLTFSYDGGDVIGGYKKSLKIFKTEVPGRDYTTIPIKSPASTLAVNPDNDEIAVGSWSGAISLFDSRARHKDEIDQLNRHRGGITYLRFLAGKNVLISGARKDNMLFVWDMRCTSQPIGQFIRSVSTNQRIYFDVSVDQSWLVSGDTSGCIHAWNLNDFSAVQEQTYQLHFDCCNGVSLHPTKPIIASSSGQHHFSMNDDGSNNDDINGSTSSNESAKQVEDASEVRKPRENSLIFWWCGKSSSTV